MFQDTTNPVADAGFLSIEVRNGYSHLDQAQRGGVNRSEVTLLLKGFRVVTNATRTPPRCVDF